MNSTQHTPESVGEHVKQVAALLPFEVKLDADMGGTFTLQIDLGTRGGVDDPPDTAGIDPDDLSEPQWWVDIEGGRRTFISNLGLDSRLSSIAAWVADTAQAEGCPAVEASKVGVVPGASSPARLV